MGQGATGILYLKNFGVVGNANYFNAANGSYYADAAFITPAVDDTYAIQKAIKACWDQNLTIGVLEFDGAKNYLIDKGELCVYGDDLVINAHKSTLIRSKQSVSASLGAVFSIFGLRPGLSYPGLAADSGPAVFNGASKAAKRVDIHELNIVFAPGLTYSAENGFGACHAQTCKFYNCTVKGAQQTSFALASAVAAGVVNAINDVELIDCTSWDSIKHSYRMNCTSPSRFFLATMIRCFGYTTKETNLAAYGIAGKKVHLVCNVSDNVAGTYAVNVEQCTFDNTGSVQFVGYSKNTTLQQCVIKFLPAPGYEVASTATAPKVS